MNFFRAQQQARGASSRLLMLFGLAVAMVVVCVTLGIYLVLGHPPEKMSLFSLQALDANLSLLFFSSTATLLFIGGASFFRVASLRGGGGQVARDLGGDRVSEDTSDPQLQRLRNVVEEIAIASGVPVPEIYVLEHEPGINAFAAGHGLSDAAVAVTRGTLEQLSREELQGVIAHEFSHILNGDMRLNLRLLGLLFGISALALIGRKVLYHFRYAGSDRRGNGIMFVALALLVAGSVGLFFARMIKAAVSRQREVLADASAVQFTRNPQGVAGALKKIAAINSGSHLAADSEEVAHMLFASGRLEHLFATHPPLLERIRAIEPGFQEGDLKRVAASLRQQLAAAEVEKQAQHVPPPQRMDGDPLSILQGIGQPHWQKILYASVLSQAIPDSLSYAARSPQRAPALVLYLLLSNHAAERESQLLRLNQHGGEALEQQVRALQQLWGPCQPEQRLPLLELAMPALKRRPRRELLELLQLAENIAAHDSEEAVFPFMLGRVLRLYLEESLAMPLGQNHGRLSLRQCAGEASGILALIAQHEGNLEPGQRAFIHGYAKLGLGTAPLMNAPDLGSPTLIKALKKLDQLRPEDKEKFIHAMLTVAFYDRRVNVSELELIRAVCATLHVPLPPMEVSRAGA